MKIREFVIMPGTADSMGLIHLPGTGPNNRFDFKNKGNNRANEYFPQPRTVGKTGYGTAHPDFEANKKTLSDRFKALFNKKKETPKKKFTQFEWDCMEGGHPLPEDAAGVGIITKQNTTSDVKPGDEYKNVKKLQLEYKEFLENFADGKKKGKSRPGRVKRAGASCTGSVTALRKKAKNASGEKAKMYHWCANMKSGRSKK